MQIKDLAFSDKCLIDRHFFSEGRLYQCISDGLNCWLCPSYGPTGPPPPKTGQKIGHPGTADFLYSFEGGGGEGGGGVLWGLT